MKISKLIAGLIVIALAVSVVGNVVAAGTFSSYNLTVPSLGRSVTTNNKTKVSVSDTATVCSEEVALNYTIRVRIEKLDNTVVAGYQTLGDLQRANYWLSPSVAGISYHARLATNWSTYVNIQAIGKWSPDAPGSCEF